MTAPRKPRKPRTKPIDAAHLQLAEIAGGMKLLGEIIAWNPKGPHSHKAVVAALAKAGLATTVAKEFKPANAMNRAIKSLEEQRQINVLGEDSAQVTFQLTRTSLGEDAEGKVLEFKKECRLRLDKQTGAIACKNADVKAKAEAELARAMDERTTSDISTIIDRLFKDYVGANPTGDLIPIREQGGAYLVLASHAGFVDSMENFITELGGKLRRFPVPAGTRHGDAAVQDQLAGMLTDLIGEHKEAVSKFTLHTRADSIEATAKRINDTRVKIEAYAAYLSEESGRLLGEVDAANAELTAAVERITEERKTAPATEGGATRTLLFGHPITAILRWMGKNGWKHADARKVMDHYKIPCSDNTIRSQLPAGTGRLKDQVPELSDEQANELKGLRS